MNQDTIDGLNIGPELDRGLGAEVGRRVCAARKAANQSRRELAGTARVSQRYLAQLEAGQANVSLNLLARIVERLNVGLHHVIPDRPLAPSLPPAPCGIGLVGLRGAGKTTLGPRLARRLSLPFVRLSRLITKRCGLEVAELLELGGMDGFRRAEREALEALIAGGTPVVLEASGGIVGAPETYRMLLQNFSCVWIKAEPRDHMDRVIGQQDLRPMDGRDEPMAELEALLGERSVDYARAGGVLDTSGRSVDDSLEQLSRLCAASAAPVPA